MSFNREQIAEAIVTEYNADMGSLHHAATGLGIFVGGISGMVVGEVVSNKTEATIELSTRLESHDSSAEMGVGALAGAVLVGAIAYQSVKRYAINSLGRDRYKEIKES